MTVQMFLKIKPPSQVKSQTQLTVLKMSKSTVTNGKSNLSESSPVMRVCLVIIHLGWSRYAVEQTWLMIGQQILVSHSSRQID